MSGRGIGRDGYEVLSGWRAGGLGHQRTARRPRLNKNIGLCYLPVGAGASRAATIQIVIRNQPVDAVTVPDAILQTSEIDMYPENFRYTKEHEWVRVEGDIGTVGITDHAQQELGDIVYVDLPKVGAQVEQGKTLGSVESVKAVSDIYAPVSRRSDRNQRRCWPTRPRS